MTLRALRLVAVLIAVAGAIDPAFTAARRTKPDVSLLASGRLPDAALVDRVAEVLARDFTVIRGAALGTNAVVSVGYERPAIPAGDRTPSFAVLPAPATPFVALSAITVPPRAHLDARVPVTVRAHVAAARGRTLRLTVAAGDVPLQVVTRAIATDDGEEVMEASVVTTAPGPLAVTVRAEIDGTAAHDEAHVATRTNTERRATLVFDTRPSWLSTFVRRAIASDPRFVVTSRVQTSRGADVTAGRAPVALGAPGVLDAFDVVIVGAPNGLTAVDAAALETYMRERGGRVVLLQDEPEASAVVQRLTGITRWTATVRTTPEGSPKTTEFLRPTARPLWASPVGPAGPVAPAEPAEPTLLSMSLGPGRLFVNTALDAWRHRETDAAFDRHWRSFVADAAHAPLTAEADATAGASNRLSPDERDLLRAWTSSRGGAVIAERDLGTLSGTIARVVSPPTERRVVRPMRSPWWIVPFGLALGAEWWLRRRRGLR